MPFQPVLTPNFTKTAKRQAFRLYLCDSSITELHTSSSACIVSYCTGSPRLVVTGNGGGLLALKYTREYFIPDKWNSRSLLCMQRFVPQMEISARDFELINNEVFCYWQIGVFHLQRCPILASFIRLLYSLLYLIYRANKYVHQFIILNQINNIY